MKEIKAQHHYFGIDDTMENERGGKKMVLPPLVSPSFLPYPHERVSVGFP